MKFYKRIRKFLVLLCVFTSINTSVIYADISKHFNFKSLTIEDGLSQSTVETIFQDSKGYIWFGTNDGLDRYNGYEFKHYKFDKYDKNSLPNNYIADIIEDKYGYLWISTIAGLSRINPETDEIKNYYTDKNNGNLSDSNLWQLLYTKDNKLIASAVNGLNVYDEKNDTFTRVLGNEKDLPSQYIYSIEEGPNGHIWIGTDNGLVEVDKNFKVVKTYEDTVANSSVYDIDYDPNGYMWICTLDNGLFKVDLDNNSIINYKSDSNKYSLPSDSVRATMHDAQGNLWIGTEKGLCRYDYETDKFITYKKEAYQNNTLVDDNIFCLFKDNSGLMWIGTYSGVSTFNPNSSFIHFKSEMEDDTINSNLIQGIYEDQDGTFWIGSNESGVNILNENSVKYLNTKNSDLLNDSIRDITGFKNNIYLGTNEGLSVLTKNDKKGEDYTITNYTEENGLPSNKVRSLYVDSKGYVWIGTNKGLATLDPNNNIIDISYIFEKIGVSDKFVRAVYEDSNGNYYIGCFLDGGLIKINPKTKKYTIYKNKEDDYSSISNNSIRDITEDSKGNILIGTSHGINILDPKTDKITHYTEKDGLINNTVYGILLDSNNGIWMSTNGGISKLSLEDGTFMNFTISDGLQSNEFNGRSNFKSKDGKLFFGGINGFNVFDPDSVELSLFKPQVIFDKFEVNGVAEKYISSKKLKSTDNNIKVSFFTNDYKNSTSAKYYYNLNGGDSEWEVSNSNTLLFANLSPGNYTLKVKAITQHGISTEEASVDFTIKRPFWISNLAIFIYVIIIAIIIYLQINKLKKLDQLVNKRTQELRGEMKKNKQLFEKIIALEKNKNNYFVNMSHELRTPLNVLNGLNQLIKGLSKKDTFITPDKLSYYMEVMERNCSRLLNLINNLIDYAKIENNSYTLNKKDENIVYLVEEIVLDMKDYIEGKGIDLIFDTDTEEKEISCDKLEIERCIVNLLGNAVKFTPEGGLIEVLIQDLKDKVKISVKDSGIGIPEEKQSMIFDKFNQVIDDNSKQKNGSGLGLTITKHLIGLHGGEIYVESKVGEGSEFIIILPVNNN